MGATPVPDRLTVCGALVLLSVMTTLPVEVPALEGENKTAKGSDCPAVRMSGGANPLMLKPAPLVLATTIDTLDVPGLLI